jgi:general L-amino acid transport system substrate-binding protein
MPDGWARRAIEAAGNHGEMFNRDIGPASPSRLQPGPNALWSNGGMIVAPTVR